MPHTRRIQGEVIFPPNAASAVARRMTIELRDVSYQDQPSVVIASKIMNEVSVAPGERVAFQMRAPPITPGRSLAMRVQVDMHANQRHAAGDYLSTEIVPVPAGGDVQALLIPVSLL
jgi:uncharacterized lipoprotein YbaY